MTRLFNPMWRNFRPFPHIWLNFTSHRALQYLESSAKYSEIRQNYSNSVVRYMHYALFKIYLQSFSQMFLSSANQRSQMPEVSGVLKFWILNIRQHYYFGLENLYNSVQYSILDMTYTREYCSAERRIVPKAILRKEMFVRTERNVPSLEEMYLNCKFSLWERKTCFN